MLVDQSSVSLPQDQSRSGTKIHSLLILHLIRKIPVDTRLSMGTNLFRKPLKSLNLEGGPEHHDLENPCIGP